MKPMSVVYTGHDTVYFFDGDTIFGVGRNQEGQLGIGTTANSMSLVEVKKNVKQMSCSWFCLSLVFLMKNGVLMGVGDGSKGEFGIRDNPGRVVPSPIDFYKGKDVKNFFLTGDALWVICENNSVYRSGYNASCELGRVGEHFFDPELLDTSFLEDQTERIVEISTDGHTLLRTNKNSVYGCGGNFDGQLGTGDTKVVSTFRKLETLSNVIQVSTGGSFSLFLFSDNTVKSCGGGRNGELGHNTKKNVVIPLKIKTLSSKRIVKVRAGSHNSMWISSKNVAFVAGHNEYYQLGFDTKRTDVCVPTQIFTSYRVLDGSLSSFSIVLVSIGGEAFASGANDYGQCCLGHSDDPISVLSKMIGVKLKFKKTPAERMNLLSYILDKRKSALLNIIVHTSS